MRKASNSVKTCSAIKKELGLNVTAEWVRRIILTNPNIRRRRLKKAPAITRVNKRKRVEFGRINTRRDWFKVSYFYVCLVELIFLFRWFGVTGKSLIWMVPMVLNTTGTISAMNHSVFREEATAEEMSWFGPPFRLLEE